MSTYTIGIDTGGTFTDAFVADGEGNHWNVKVPTTPHDLTVCFADAIARCADEVGLSRSNLLRQSDVIRFSSTIATNTILTSSGPKIGLLVTAGHESSLYGAAEGGRMAKFVAPAMVRGIDEHVDDAGRVVRPVDTHQLEEVVRDLLEQGVRLLVVALRHAALNPENERAVVRAIDSSYPRHYLGAVPTLLSTQVSAVADDASRAASAIVNAYVHKQLSLSLYKAEDDLRRDGFRHPLLVVTGDGSVTRVSKTRALSTYQSGPAAGVHASALLASAHGLGAALTADVGGTSTDLGFVADGRPVVRRTVDVDGLEVNQPAVEVFSIALGGGSVARVVDGRVEVGPESAGSVPGPAAFGMGGREPTPTDAWLVLGYLSPGFYLGGRRKLQVQLAERALMNRIGEPLGVGVEEAALAVARGAEDTARRGIEAVLSRSHVGGGAGGGELPALVAYGGGGGILLPSVAVKLGVGSVLLSPLAPVFSAFGVSTLDVRHRYEARLTAGAAGAAGAVDAGLRQKLDSLVAEARRDLRGEGFGTDDARFSVSLLSDAGRLLADELSLEQVADAITRITPADDEQLVLSLSATCEVRKPGLPRARRESDPELGKKEERKVLWESGPSLLPVYDGDRLAAGQVLTGPALIETAGTTSLVPSEMTAEIDEFGTAILRRTN